MARPSPSGCRHTWSAPASKCSRTRLATAWASPDGSDGDSYAYDSFQIGCDLGIAEIDWRGGYAESLPYAGQNPVYDFAIGIYASASDGGQPDLSIAPLGVYKVGGNAGETLAGTFGGTPMFDYRFVLPVPFQAAAGVTYMIGGPRNLIGMLRYDQRREGDLKVGDRAPDVTLLALDGKTRADRNLYAETYYPRFHYGWSDLHSLISDASHYIQAPKPELYDMAADPGEMRNILQANRRTYVAMRERIVPFVKGAESPKAVDPEQARQLAALGYVGSTVSTTSAASLPDPKDHISSAGDIKQGFRDFQEQRYEAAAQIFDKLLRQNPNMLDIWTMQTRVLDKLGRREEAIDAAKQGMRVSPTATQLAIAVANMSLELNRLDDAQSYARLALKDLPNEAHHLLAQVWLRRKDFARAKQEAEASMGAHRDRPAAIMLLGEIAKEEGKIDEALRSFDQAAAILEKKHRPAIPGLNFQRGDALARMGQAAQAEAAFQKEIELYPSDPQPYKNLILLYVTQGKNDAATRLIFSLEKANPAPPSYIAISETLKIIGDRNGARFWAARGLRRFPLDRQLKGIWSAAATPPLSAR